MIDSNRYDTPQKPCIRIAPLPPICHSIQGTKYGNNDDKKMIKREEQIGNEFKNKKIKFVKEPGKKKRVLE